MVSYIRLGSFLLADEAVELPYGRLQLARSLAGKALDRHHLLFTFSDELLAAGLGSRGAEVQKAIAQLAGTREFGAGHRFEPGRPPHLVCDYLPGRTLARVLAKVKEEQLPLAVDHALMVLQGLGRALVQLHERGLRHGLLSPHSAWITFEGAALVLDAPAAATIHSLLPGAPALKAALAPWCCPAPASAFHQDLYSLGAVFYELLTLEAPPGPEDLAEALDRATLRAAQEEMRLPEELLAFLKRLLMVGLPFGSVPEFNASLERVLYEAGFNPTPFDLAFLMHTLLQAEHEAEAAVVRSDQALDFTPHLPDPGAAPAPAAAGRGRRGPTWVAGGALAVAAVLGFLYFQLQRSDRQRELDQRSLQARLESFQRDKEAADARAANQARQEEARNTLDDLFGPQAAAPDPPQAPSPALDAQPMVAQRSNPQPPQPRTLPAALQQKDLKVSLKVLVDPAGKPRKVVILKGVEGNYGYNDSAQNAALASTFIPGRRNGKPAAGWLSMEFDFGKPQ
jgi:serine/threonine protein kinase